MFISVQSGGDSPPEVLDAPPVGQNQPMGEVARREVDWAVRRWRGEGVDSIARQAGVAPTVVRHAIAWVAPLTGTKASTSAAEAALWVQLRQMGHSTASVAGYFGVTAATVRRHRTVRSLPALDCLDDRAMGSTAARSRGGRADRPGRAGPGQSGA